MTTPVIHDGRTYFVKFYVVNRNALNILGPDTCLKLNLVRSMNTISSSESDMLSELQYDYIKA